MTQEQIDKAYQDMYEYEKEIRDHNDMLLKTFGETALTDFIELLESTSCNGKIEFVDAPKGTDQEDDAVGIFSNVRVDQWSRGTEGDSFAGFIYAQLPDNRWIQVPYEC